MAMNLTRHRPAVATIGNNLQVGFERTALIGFRSCISRSFYRNVSNQTTRSLRFWLDHGTNTYPYPPYNPDNNKLSVDLNEPKDSSKTDKAVQNGKNIGIPASYIGGHVSSVNIVDIDEFCLHDLKDMVVKLGYGVEDLMYCYFLIPSLGLDYGLHSLNVDADVLEMEKYVKDYKIILVYVEHGSSNVDTSIFVTPKKGVAIAVDNHLRKAPIEIDSSHDVNRNLTPMCHRILEKEWEHVSSKSLSVGEYAHIGKQITGNEITRNESTRNEITGKQMVVHVGVGPVGKFKEVEVDADNESEEESDTKGDYTMDSDSEDLDYDLKQDDVFDDDEHIVEEVHVNMNNFIFTVDPKHDTSIGGVDVQYDDLDVIDYDSFGSDLDDEIDSKRSMQLRELRRIGKLKNKGPNKYYFYLGQQFAIRCEGTILALVPYVAIDNNTDKNIFSQTKGSPAVRENINSSKQNILGKDKTVKGKGKKVNTPKKLDKNPCPWTMLITFTKECRWEVRTLIEDHTCIQSRAIKACTSRFLADHVIKSLASNPDIPVRAVQDQMQKQFEVGVLKMEAFRTKRIASDIMTGSYREQYSLLREYAQELINQNPGTTVRIDVHQEPNPESLTRTFRRVYMCLGALKQGFRACRREILGLDGCFMSGPWPGQTLTTVGVDSNNGIYPVAYAIVEAESKASWCWFLNLLGEDLGIEANFNYTFIFDRQKGLIQAIASVFPSAEHRYSKATSEGEFKKKMGELKSFNSDAYDWLLKIPLEQWSKAYFSGRAKCDLLINNICEVFNRQLVDGRDQPIITCLEYIREYLMKRIMVVQKVIAKTVRPLTPSVTKMKWELTGIPCKHAMDAIYNMSENSVGVGIPEQWVHAAYRLETWEHVYSFKVNPCNGRDMWPVVESRIVIIPPLYKPLIGRPSKKRKKLNDEIASQSASSGNVGHNRKGCRGQGGGSSQAGARKVSGQAAGATNVSSQAAIMCKVGSSGLSDGATNVSVKLWVLRKLLPGLKLLV
ncbi:mutator type transposase [Tanacetum coccineum]